MVAQQDLGSSFNGQDASPNEVFISYSRRDREFVIKLDNALRQTGRASWIDWSDIQPAEDWWKAIERGIESASNFVFIISPDSITSKVCRQELEYGLEHNKRLVPLLWREGFNMDDVHPAISRHNWIFFRETDDFEQAFSTLLTALDTDLDYARNHTRLLVRAKEWQRKLADSSFLLRGTDLLEAEQWLETSNTKQPKPTELHRSYVHASRKDELERQEVELRLRRMSPQQYRNRQTLLNKVRNYWIKEVLENSLQDRVLMELGLEERMDDVIPPWYIPTANPDSAPKPLPEGTRVTTLFDQLGEGRTLLILGEPGAGKTTTLLNLAQDLVTRAEQGIDDRIPIVFNLSSWLGGNQTIRDWLVSELSTKYQIPSAIGQTWIEEQYLLLLLDGLDEVKTENQNACVIALNQFQQQYGAEMVVCCRVQDYESLKHRLNFQQAVLVRSLTPEQIHHYLESGGSELDALKTLLAQDKVLQELAQSPLMLNIMALVYRGTAIANLPSLDLEAQRHHLFNAFIERTLRRRGVGDRYSRTQVIHYLTWLAQRMVQESRSVFLIEDLQPTWLPNAWVQRMYQMMAMGLVSLICGISMGLLSKISNYAIEIDLGISIGIIAGPIAGIATSLLPTLQSNWSFGIMAGLVSGLVFGLTGQVFHSDQPLNMGIFGLICGLVLLRLNPPHIEPADTVQWSWAKGKQKFIVGLLWGLTIGGTLLIMRWRLLPPDLLDNLCNRSPESLSRWAGSVLINFLCQENRTVTLNMLLGLLALGVFVGLNVGLALGFRKIPEIESRTIPNHGIWKSVRNTVKLIGICGPIAALISVLFWLIYASFPSSYPGSPDAITSEVIWWFHYGKQLVPDGLMLGLSVGVLLGLVGGLVGGENSGIVIVQHFVLRYLLWKTRCTPWNYAHFLNYAADRILLKKVGGGYIFIHRLLLEHFAQLKSRNLVRRPKEMETLE
ncbi:TIR domain-containing protein [Oscillatoria sp. FACHB-1407]|uniref:TIR domain-containing protein n=1 Tax=Oscillatoria sp. FACHB-1407 TaxID=2692847 RepID=UPI001686A6A3|nr:TIR domain-containing protein [Oscillatoria sp. FACHB-1407]MBD2459647.1 TIR domain-containing protein [Oscillatoria sp. FACHB-1407]